MEKLSDVNVLPENIKWSPAKGHVTLEKPILPRLRRFLICRSSFGFRPSVTWVDDDSSCEAMHDDVGPLDGHVYRAYSDYSKLWYLTALRCPRSLDETNLMERTRLELDEPPGHWRASLQTAIGEMGAKKSKSKRSGYSTEDD